MRYINSLVIDGDYKHSFISTSKESGILRIERDQSSIELAKSNIDKYDIVYIEYKKSIIDILLRIIICSYLIGILGLLAGFTASNTYESYRIIDVEFKDGKKSRIKINKKQFKQLLEIM
ncbi:MAG: hypothetical protein ACLTT7_08980 [Paraclostridium bifermentans]